MYLVSFIWPLAFVNKNTPYLIGPFPFFLGYIFNDVQSCFKGPSSKSKTRHTHTHTHTPTTRQFPRCLQMSFSISHHHFDHGITIDLSGGLPLPSGWDNQSIPRKVPDRHGKPYSFLCIFSTHVLLIYKLILGLKRSFFYPQKCWF